MTKKILLSAVIALGIYNNAHAQGMAVNTSGSAAASSAMLDVSSTTKGVLIPRMTATERGNIASPALGLMVYQTDAPAGFYYHNGTAWTMIGGGAPTGSAGGDLTGTYPNPTIANSAITSAKILDGTITNSDVSTTASIAYSKLNLTGSVGIADHSATGTASSSTYLRGDNTWATISGGAPTGSAGGDLTGTYPNPTIANSSVTVAKIASTGGTASNTTYLRGDGQWATPSGGGGGSVAHDFEATASSFGMAAGTTATAPSVIALDGVVKAATVGTFTPATFTYRTGAAGAYLITVAMTSTPGSGNLGVAPVVYVDGVAAIYGSVAGSTFFPSPIARGTLSNVITLAAGKDITFRVSNGSNAATTVHSTRVSITKLSD